METDPQTIVQRLRAKPVRNVEDLTLSEVREAIRVLTN
jgi:hypothetical protein